MGFKENILKFQVYPILSQVDNQDLKDLYMKLYSLLPIDMIPLLEAPNKDTTGHVSGSGQ